jgi:prephenate dehydrogenase
MKDLDDFTIAIAGLGLMGGSLALALKKNGVGLRLLGMDPNPLAVSRALEMGAIDAPAQSFSGVDLIVLAMPVRGIIQWLNTTGRTLPANCLVIDLGSTKQEIVAAMAQLAALCIGGHPMCGKETSGIGEADAELFRGAKFVLSPTARTSGAAMHVTQALIERIGAQALVMDAADHDRAVAAVSHMPYLLSAALVNCVDDLHDEHTGALAASGFRSMTRLAASDLSMIGDIIATNRSSIVDLLDRYDSELRELRTAIVENDESRWRSLLKRAYNLNRNP